MFVFENGWTAETRYTCDFVIEGLSPLEPIPDYSVGELIYQSLLTRKNGNAALIDSCTGKYVTFSDLLIDTCSLAKAITSLGFGHGTSIGICSKNNLQYFIPVIASLYIGATVVTINPSYTYTELLHVTRITKPKIIFCAKDILNTFMKIREEVQNIEKLVIIDCEKNSSEVECMRKLIEENVIALAGRWMTTPVNVNDSIAFILSSSGTTGLPKGVMLSHRNVNAIITHFRDHRIHDQNPVTYCAVPFFHAYGLFVALADLVLNCPTIFSASFKPELLLNSIQHHKVTRLILVPPIIVILAKCVNFSNYDLSSVKEVICSAAPLKELTEEAFRKGIKTAVIRQGYGLTELTHCLMFNGIENFPPRYGSVGRVLPFVKVAVRDLTTGQFLGPNQKGEIWVKGDVVMKGYLNNPDANKTAFAEGGWFRTGDVGYYDEHEYFFITDRIKDLIKYKGFQVAPAELEGVLLTHPEINDAAVIGVLDEIAGELPLAFVVKSNTSRITAEDVQDFVKSQLSPQKWLRGGVIFVETISKNQSGKIVKKELREMLKNHMSKL